MIKSGLLFNVLPFTFTNAQKSTIKADPIWTVFGVLKGLYEHTINKLTNLNMESSIKWINFIGFEGKCLGVIVR